MQVVEYNEHSWVGGENESFKDFGMSESRRSPSTHRLVVPVSLSLSLYIYIYISISSASTSRQTTRTTHTRLARSQICRWALVRSRVT